MYKTIWSLCINLYVRNKTRISGNSFDDVGWVFDFDLFKLQYVCRT